MKLRLMISVLVTSLYMPQAQAQILDDVIGSVTETIDSINDEVLPNVTNIRLGLGPVVNPDYRGSDDYGIKPAPLISFHYKDIFQVDNNHLRINVFGSDSLIKSEYLDAGPTASIDFGRDENDNPDLSGLGGVGTSIELGAFASYRLGPTRTRIKFRHDVTSGHGGMEINADFRVLIHKTDKTTVVGSLSSSWADGDYMDAFYSITPVQALASGLPGFDAGASFKDVRVDFAVNYQFSRHWAFIANGGYARLLNDAADSPIVSLRGSANQLQGGLFAVYSF